MPRRLAIATALLPMLAFAAALLGAGETRAAGEIRYRVVTLAGDTDLCLDVVNDAKKDRVTLAKCNNKVQGQFWTVEPYGKLREGHVRLRSSLSGENRCLDIVNDEMKNQVVMARCGNYTGQMWTIQMVGPDGLSQMRTRFTGATRCLQVFPDGDKYNRVMMSDCDDRDTQQYRFELEK